MTELQLTRLRQQLQNVRRAPEWHIVRQLCTAAASDKSIDLEDFKKELTEEIVYIAEQEVAAAKERAHR